MGAVFWLFLFVVWWWRLRVSNSTTLKHVYNKMLLLYWGTVVFSKIRFPCIGDPQMTKLSKLQSDVTKDCKTVVFGNI